MQVPVVVLILSALLTCPCVSSEVVGICPRTKAEWERESVLLHCQEPYHYHCVRDDTGHFMQLCSQKIWIQKGMYMYLCTSNIQISTVDIKSPAQYV